MYFTYLSKSKYVASWPLLRTAVIVIKNSFTLPDLNMQPKAMIVALSERNDIGGLAKDIDLLKDLHATLAFNKLPSKLGRQLSRQSTITK